jgi:type VI secretion system secreted protein VgrG
MEVVVNFLGGDQDRPVVMGCLYNAIQNPSFVLPGAQTRSGIRTNSTPGGGGRNELSFEDAIGTEEVYLRAQRDLVEEVGRNAAVTIRANRSETINEDSRSAVLGDRHEETAGGKRDTVQGSHVSTIDQDRAITVSGARATHIDESDTLHVGGDRSVDVSGANVVAIAGSESRDVAGASVTLIHGSASHIVSKSATVVVDESCSVGIRKGLALAVGSSDEKSNATIGISGDCQASVGGDMELIIEKSIRIRAGTSSITIGPDGIRIEADSITLVAKSISALGEKSSLDVGEKVEIRGKTVKISSAADAIIELDKDAKIDGSPGLKLNGKNAAEEAAREEKAPEIEKAEKLTVQLFDLHGEAISDAPYEVTFPGYIARGTAADGTIEVPKLKDVEKCFVRWARPASARSKPASNGRKPPEFEFEMEVYLSFDDPEEHENLRRKLHNLGHPDPRGLEHAVASYQSALGADAITGNIDDVKDELAGRHDDCKPVSIKPDTGTA